jgi:signal peptidase I
MNPTHDPMIAPPAANPHSELPPPVSATGTRGPYVSPPSKHETLREIISTIGVLVAALLVAFGLIAWVFQSYEVDGPSMETSLMNQDRLIVWKVPRTVARITHHQYVPNRGDVIIFVESGLSQFGQDDNKQLIKRVIGLPGERVVVADGKLTVYNAAHPGGFQPDKTMSYGSVIDETTDTHNIDITLAKDQLFVCGDNRPDSLDSRTFGPIQTHQIVGKLALRLLPLKDLQKF